MDWYQDVLDFHRKFKCYTGDKPHIPSPDIKKLRKSLIKEEEKELRDALQKKDLVEAADAITDLLYVTIGTAIALGIDIRPIWDEVHKTNMEKVGGSIREDGKVLKPAGWQPPKIKELIEKQQKGEA